MDKTLISQIRASSRKLVREFGLLNTWLVHAKLSTSAVHAIVEIGIHEEITARELSAILRLEKSTVSRLIKKLIQQGVIDQRSHNVDARFRTLCLTPQGRKTWSIITKFADHQVETALKKLSRVERNMVAEGLSMYASALKEGAHTQPERRRNSDDIKFGYFPGLVGSVVEMHANFYSTYAGFGAYFERKVATELSEFIGRLSSPENQIWHARKNGQIVASISIDGNILGDNQALLRWFIVDAHARGSGFGKELLERAVSFCDQRSFTAIQLSTFRGLDAARKLYEDIGFELVGEFPGNQWGVSTMEQKFQRSIPHTDSLVANPQV